MNNKNIMIATPAYSGKVNTYYALSLMHTYHLLKKHNIEVSPIICSSGSLLVAERNRILQEFWNSSCTHLLMIDSDLGWPAEAVIAMLHMEKDFIAGVYPARNSNSEFLFRPVLDINGSIVQEKHLLKMNYIPTGFILITRNMLFKMHNKFPELYYEPKNKNIGNPASGYCLFDTQVWEGEFWGEDFVFCRRAREAGIDIWVDPLIQFEHSGQVGMLIQSLSQSPSEFKPVVYNIKEK
jgi:hypothetical protein